MEGAVLAQRRRYRHGRVGDAMTPYYDDGQVTLYHGDSRAVLAAMSDESVDFIFTDPPYGHNNNDGDLIHAIEKAIPSRRRKGDDGTVEYEARPIANDGPEANELVRWLFREAKRLLRNGSCCCCCCGGGGPDPQFARWSLWMDEVLNFKQMIVWDKGPMGMGWHYRRSYETVLVAQRGAGRCNWYDETDRIENIVRHIPKIIPSKDEHPTPKPPALVEWFIQLHSKPGDLVLDPFNGGGSTAVAARRMGRRYIGCDVERRWLDMTIRKIESQTMALPL